MDRRQILERIGATTFVGDLADDVVIACSRVSGAAPTGGARKVLDAALSIVRALGEFERPMVLTPASLDAMSATEIVSDTVGRLGPRWDTDDLRPTLVEIAADLERVLDDWADEAARGRVQRFFGVLAQGMLSSSESMLKPHIREAPWMPAASSF